MKERQVQVYTYRGKSASDPLDPSAKSATGCLNCNVPFVNIQYLVREAVDTPIQNLQ